MMDGIVLNLKHIARCITFRVSFTIFHSTNKCRFIPLSGSRLANLKPQLDQPRKNINLLTERDLYAMVLVVKHH